MEQIQSYCLIWPQTFCGRGLNWFFTSLILNCYPSNREDLVQTQTKHTPQLAAPCG